MSKIFERMDTNSDNMLSLDELKAGMQLRGFTNQIQIESMFYAMDIDRSGKVDYREFLTSHLDNNIFDINADKLKLLFEYLDFDHSGYLEHDEIKKIIGCEDEAVVD